MATTTLYLRLGESAPSGVTLPSGPLGGWGADGGTGETGSGAKMLDPNKGSSQLTVVASDSLSGDVGFTQLFSAPLAAQTISAGSWLAALAAQSVPNPPGTYARIFIGVMKGDGSALRGTILPLTNISTNQVYGAGEASCYNAALSGSAVAVSANDVLLVEIGVDLVPGGYTAGNITLYADGSTEIVSDYSIVSNAASKVVCPQALVFASAVTPPLPTIIRQAAQRAAVW